ncbi:MAG: amidoligase family protein [Lachnospiraceae bacterium]|nr:amidoligase family protein [Lachnospiraceae bacterium]
MLKNQLFGVEVEMTGITREKAAQVVADVLGTIPGSPNNTCYKTRIIKDMAARKWKIMRDSSIMPIRNDNGQSSLDEYRVEFVTPPLNYGDIELLQTIIRKLKENGAKSHRSCGIHIHVDGANHDAKSLRRLINFMTSRQDLIYEALEIGNRANHWCHKLNAALLDEMKKDKNISRERVEQIWYSSANDGYTGNINHEHYNCTRYHGVNLHSYFSKGTVEFRLFNSTLHAEQIKAYIQFCLAVSAWAITSQEKIVFRSMKNYTAEQKVTIMRNILTHRLGLYGDEFKTCRLHLMTPLKKAVGMTCRVA